MVFIPTLCSILRGDLSTYVRSELLLLSASNSMFMYKTKDLYSYKLLYSIDIRALAVIWIKAII